MFSLFRRKSPSPSRDVLLREIAETTMRYHGPATDWLPITIGVVLDRVDKDIPVGRRREFIGAIEAAMKWCHVRYEVYG